VIQQPVSVVSQCGAECLAVELASRDQRRPTGSGSALEALRNDALRNDALYKSTLFTLLFLPSQQTLASLIALQPLEMQTCGILAAPITNVFMLVVFRYTTLKEMLYCFVLLLQQGSSVPLQSTDSVKVDGDKGQVVFQPLNEADKGEYTCKAINDVGEATAKGRLTVRGWCPL